jgi:hypothetical protein
LPYDIHRKVVDFLTTAPHRYMLRFKIHAAAIRDGFLTLSFSQIFTSVSEEGNELLYQYKAEDFTGRLRTLGEFMNQYIENKSKRKKP